MKTEPETDDDALSALFATPQAFDDAERFEAQVSRRLQVKLWMRQWLVALAGIVGGLYALAQFVRVPTSITATGQSMHRAVMDTDQTLRAGFNAMDQAGRGLTGLAEDWGHTLVFMQTPVFFWVSFTLCLMLLGLYYAYSQEETL